MWLQKTQRDSTKGEYIHVQVQCPGTVLGGVLKIQNVVRPSDKGCCKIIHCVEWGGGEGGTEPQQHSISISAAHGPSRTK